MTEQPSQRDIRIYTGESGDINVLLEQESIWLTQRQLSDLLETSTDNISLHLKNIYQERELEADATTEDFSVVRQEGKRQVRRRVKHYNLDAIISVAYRVNSRKGTQFRQWATAVLKEHLSRGYTINRQRFEDNARELEAALKLVRKAAASPELLVNTGRGLVEIVSRYTQTFLWLQRYDEGLLNEPTGQPGGMLATEQQVMASLLGLKQNLVQRGEATELFAKPRGDGLGALLGNLDQSAFGEPAYPTIESKAAHLLYFVVKNHPFTDGNKRSGAFLFVDFLHRNGRLLNDSGEPVINDTGLAALTLLVAESDPKQKETLIRLIMNMLADEETEDR
ncbi:virulence RhuM family protein [Endozoicomonas gorgoniicola]|uniref:Virulence RhuM family protein n=1 Tax=Endozoicomonas gorgoniicola TaxID=1234144 RepID=A0ABT3MZJ3_9GAMM|nr:virulence protein RhuM/Fic/DOC family protein [Endozoicomonas gorgoniicola]MCW7554790.1 virulence RhuM family protein [Endozoicomonas gorgoniicola]